MLTRKTVLSIRVGCLIALYNIHVIKLMLPLEKSPKGGFIHGIKLMLPLEEFTKGGFHGFNNVYQFSQVMCAKKVFYVCSRLTYERE